MLKQLPALCLALLGLSSTSLAVSMPRLFDDNMVLQSGTNTALWGWADPDEVLSVDLEGVQAVAVTADATGRWKHTFSNLTPGTNAYTLAVEGGTNLITLTNLVVGDVWFCAGQSNMDMGMYGASNSAAELSDSAYPYLRLFQIRPAATGVAQAVDIQFKPLNYVATNEGWVASRDTTANLFSALAFSFGRALQRTNGTPIGLVQASVGATALDQWVSPLAFEADPRFGLTNTFSATNYYNGSVEPLTNLAIRGALWYQGEAEGDGENSAYGYRNKLDVLVKSWRAAFPAVDFPFIAIQIHNYGNIHPTKAWDELRDSQSTLLLTNHTALVVGVDVGDALNLHPANKIPLGERAALAARALAYGETNLLYQGPVLQSHSVVGTNVILTFSSIGTGLVVRGGGSSLVGFTLSGSDTNFFHATATIISSNQVLINNPRVSAPAGVRYSWGFNPQEANLGNSANLPANAFRTDSFGVFSGGPNKIGNLAFAGDVARTSSAPVSLFRGNLQRTGVYPGRGMSALTNRLWRYATGDKVRSTPAIQDGVVFFTSNDTNIYAVAATNGDLRWQFNAGLSAYGFGLSGDFSSAPTLADGVLIAPMEDHLIALNASNGAYRYCFKPQAYNINDDRLSSSAVVDDTFVFIGAAHLFALDPRTGSRKADYGLHWNRKSPATTRCAPAILDGLAYFTEPTFFSVTLTNLALTGLPVNDSAFNTNVASSGLTPCAALAGGSAVVANSNVVKSINLTTRTTNWTFTAPAVIESSPALYKGTIYVGCNDSNLYALSLATGASNWTFASGGAIKSSPAVANGLVFFGSDDGKVYSVTPAGALVSSYQTGGPVSSSPVIQDGVLYIGSDDGYLYALTGDDTTPPLLESAASPTNDLVNLLFNEPLDSASAASPANYTLSGGASVTNAGLSSDGLTVTLFTTPLATNQPYALTLTNVTDLAGNPVAAGTQTTVTYFATIPTYSVTYQGNGHTGGSAPTDPNQYPDGATVTVYGNSNSLVKTSYDFGGWTNAGGTAYTPGGSFVMGAANVVLFAKWLSNSTPTLIAYEGFDITPGPGALSGAGGGSSSGWTTLWTSGATNNVLSSGLSYTNGGNLVCTGGAAQLSYTTGSYRNFAPPYSTATGTCWISFIAQIPSNGSSWCGLSLFNTFGNEIVFLGDLSGATNWGAQVYGTGGLFKTSNIPVSVQVFLVARIDFNVSGNLDNTLVWINPDIGSTPPEDGSATLSLPGVDFSGSGNAANVIRIRLQQGSNAYALFDEIRLGKTWADVSPTAPTSADADADGIPDAWEQEIFGTTTNTAAGDNDGDGVSNYEEYVADTQPTNELNRFEMDQVTRSLGLSVVAAGRSNRSYYLWRSTNAASASPLWTIVSSTAALGSHSNVVLTDTNQSTLPGAWYRLEVTAP